MPMVEKISRIELLALWNMVYNISISMVMDPKDAEDITQEIFLKIQDKVHTFRGESQLSTWVYRVARNHLYNICKKRQREKLTFELFEKDITGFTPYDNEFDLSEEQEIHAVTDIKIGCTTAMLQCLDVESRFIIIIGTIFDMSSRDASSVCELREDSYRQKLSRARRKLKSFMTQNCGLMNPNAECQCRKRVQIAAERGRIDLSQKEREIHLTIKELTGEMNEIDEVSEIYRDNLFIEKDDLLLSQLQKRYKILNDVVLS